jgi:neutral ceramidase
MLGYANSMLLFPILSVPLIGAYRIGTASYDITGPCNQIVFMGYACPEQVGSGIHLRLKARAFVFEDDTKIFGFVNLDTGMASDIVTAKVIEKTNVQLGQGVFSYVGLPTVFSHTISIICPG